MGAVGFTLDLQVRVAVVRCCRHADRHARAAFPFGHAFWQLLSSARNCFLHGFGHRPASTEGASSSPTTRATAARRIKGPPMREPTDRTPAYLIASSRVYLSLELVLS